ncbi:hypothetical protein PIB30_067610, partial [Stylosanthes scabra]|nr:hypothetical protein [Stylosanthes scabra]
CYTKPYFSSFTAKFGLKLTREALLSLWSSLCISSIFRHQRSIAAHRNCATPLPPLQGLALSCSVRYSSQIHELDAEENKVDLGGNQQLHERIRKIENECMMLKMLACMNLLSFVFCMFFILVLLFKF